MYKLICRECGKPFDSPNPRYVTCSAECRDSYRRKQEKERMASYRETNANKRYRKIYYKEHYKYVNKTCKSCGDKLTDGRQSFCLTCLLIDYLHGDHNTARQRLACRGYDKAMILEELQNRNII